MKLPKTAPRRLWRETRGLARLLANSLLPPALANALRSMRRAPVPALEYLPGGWGSAPPPEAGENGWDVDSTASGTACERAQFESSLANGAPLGIAHEHNLHVSFAYALALVAGGKSSISVLDWGAGLGQYSHVAKAALPGIDIDYHCKEVPVLAKAGEQRAAAATWHTDDSCLQASYDLVFASGSPQYAKDWEELLAKLAAASRDYLLLTRIPVVVNSQNFAVMQRVYGSRMVFWVFRQSEFIDVVRRQGFELVREFLVQDWPPVHDAPEQCELRGWLFRRAKPQ
jgi:putative methyltransferase (TIGR04325 family)